jgi:hypothetical protein
LAQSFGIDTNDIRGLEMELADADKLIFPYFLFVNTDNKILSIYIPYEANNEADKKMLLLMLKQLNEQ